MKTYARLQNGAVAELLSTGADISSLFNPALVWVDVSDVSGVQVGWQPQATGGLGPPPSAPVPAGANIVPITAASLQAQLAVLQEQLNALTVTVSASAVATH